MYPYQIFGQVETEPNIYDRLTGLSVLSAAPIVVVVDEKPEPRDVDDTGPSSIFQLKKINLSRTELYLVSAYYFLSNVHAVWYVVGIRTRSVVAAVAKCP